MLNEFLLIKQKQKMANVFQNNKVFMNHKYNNGFLINEFYNFIIIFISTEEYEIRIELYFKFFFLSFFLLGY